ncbi:SGNH hydrolase-type esterase domain-containing protein [Crucibulum laeve]|uniref:SGNH hydrolase-type esterase domain-containing protein n=1 Tax=Crucibulum laeve TaxID=68775 RepID=A0A5C3LLQ6_9AGAR|nr:SGNH hydrolase-type esterase domain-containing protein [Crucibulum laeve]
MAAFRLVSLANAALILLLFSCNVVKADPVVERQHSSAGHWVDTWGAMPQLTEQANLPPLPFTQPDVVFNNSTIRQTLHMSIGGNQIRLRISNAFGTSDLPITAVTVALPVNGSAGVSTIQTRTIKTVTFSGLSSVIIPNGALVVSDPIDFPVKSQSMITVTIYTQEGQTTNNITSHPGSRTTSWFCTGNFVSSEDLTGGSTASVAHWYFLSAVEVWAPTTTGAFVIVGDSITDGRGSTDNANNRWPDLVLAKMQQKAATRNIAVINQAAGGNRILADGLGPNALGRIDRDVIAQSSVRYAMIFEGVNDIGTAATDTQTQQAVGDRVIWAMKQIVIRLRTFNMPIFAATITPFGGEGQVYSDPNREVTRKRVNNFIRTSGTFDAVIDFDKILGDPSNSTQLAPQFDSGDHLHPNVAGYQAIADAFPLNIFNIAPKNRRRD